MEEEGRTSPSTKSFNCIEHRVSKLDTLAGIAIKYGVEVADIKRTNGLATDIQMFALNSLRIPLPGRHPPSSSISNGSTLHGGHRSPEKNQAKDLLRLAHSPPPRPPRLQVSAAMKILQGYYGLTPSLRSALPGDQVNTPQRGHRKSMSLVSTPPPELLLKEDQGGSASASSARTSASKGLAQRQKAASLRPETTVKKSSSASDLQETKSEGKVKFSLGIAIKSANVQAEQIGQHPAFPC